MGSRVKTGSGVSVLISACREGNTHTTRLTKSAWMPHFETCPKGKDFILQCGHDGKCFLCSGYNTMKFKSNLILICNSHSFLALGVRDKEVCFLLFQPTNPHTHTNCCAYVAVKSTLLSHIISSISVGVWSYSLQLWAVSFPKLTLWPFSLLHGWKSAVLQYNSKKCNANDMLSFRTLFL